MDPVRKETRVVAPVALLLEIDGKSEACFTRNISVGGLFVVTKRVAPEGAKVHISIVRGKERLETSAKVVTRTTDGLGLRFINPGPAFGRGVEALIAEVLQHGQIESGTVDHETDAGMSWCRLPDGKSWNWWRKARRKAHLDSLSHDGAALRTRGRPDIGESILVFLGERGVPDGNLTSHAEVVRHTDHGFAVRFVTPSVEFRRMISTLRRKPTGRV